MGVIEVWRIEDEHLIKRINVYKVRYRSFEERDAQWVFISKMKLHDGSILIMSERSRCFLLDPVTLIVKEIKCEEANTK